MTTDGPAAPGDPAAPAPRHDGGMTFSIVGRSANGSALGVAVASKFLAAGAYVPAAAADAGAIATQAHVNLELKTRGLEMLREGVGAGELLERFFTGDPHREERQ